MRYMLFIFVLVTSLFSQTFIKEYTYHASENDSKLSARKAALNQIRILAIEEVGVSVSSSYSKEQKQNNEEFSKIISDKIETFSQAFTKTKILDEKWNGEEFYIKVEIVVDPDKVGQNLRHLTNKSPKEVCEDIKKKALDKLYDLSSSEKIDSFSSFAIKYEFNKCNDWHYIVMNTFAKNDLNPKKYRSFLLETLKGIEFPSKDKRAVVIIRYLISSMSEKEFDTVFENIKKMENNTFYDTVYNLASSQNRVQKYSFDKMFNASSKGIIGRPIAFVQSDILFYLLDSLDNRKSKLFVDYYLKYGHLLTNKQKYQFYKSFKSRFFQDPQQKYFDIIVSYLKTLEPSENSSSLLYDFVSYCETKSKSNKKFKKYVLEFMSKLKGEMNKSFPFTPYSSGIIDRKKLFIKYNVDADFTPTPQECATEMFTQKNESMQLEYVRFLVLMKEKALIVEKELIQKLKQAKKGSSITSSVMEKELIIALSNIHTKNKKAIYLITDSLSSKRHKVSDVAKTALIKIGYPSFKIIKYEFNDKEDYVKAKMIEIMGTYTTNKDEVIEFLKTLKTNNTYVEKVIKEAVAELMY